MEGARLRATAPRGILVPMRWVPVCALLLIAALPATAQDGCDDSGIEIDSHPNGPEPEAEKKPAPKREQAPAQEPDDERKSGDDFKPPSAEEIDRAIDRGVAWLRKAQKKDGSWDPCVAVGHYGDPNSRERTTCYDLGPTAFSLFALGTCGVDRNDIVIRHGLDWIDSKSRYGYEWTSYEASALVLALTALNGTKAPRNPKALPRTSGARPPKGTFRYDDWNMMSMRVQGLLECTLGGGFRYWPRGDGIPDVSATQFAILALRSASFAGYPVEKTNPDVWRKTAEFLTEAQTASGGFPYQTRGRPSRGMTAAGLSSLLICKEQMTIKGDKEPRGIEDAITKGLAYLDANFDLTSNPSPDYEGQSHYHYCYLYALERTGVLSLHREFDGKDWYTRGAAWLLGEEGSDGGWNDGTCMDPKDVLGTCFALLFLKRATPPAVTVSGD